MSFKRVLLVEPDGRLRAQLRDAVRALAHIDIDASLPAARTHLLAHPYDWLVTNIRLEAYNGLHLVHLAASARLPVRILVYSDRRDMSLAREGQRLGAFYDSRDCVHRAIAAYLRGTLPPRDRRNPTIQDRRAVFRGGRRCIDFPPGQSMTGRAQGRVWSLATRICQFIWDRYRWRAVPRQLFARQEPEDHSTVATCGTDRLHIIR